MKRKLKANGKKRIEGALEKCPTGIRGLDEVTMGGLPKGRPTLVCGGAGSGKTVLGIEFLVRGALAFNEPGVCISFEETENDMAQNVASLGFDLRALIKSGKLGFDYIEIDRSEIVETGEYDLEGLFVRLGGAIDSIGAKRVLVDTVESLFAGLSDEGLLRSEFRRLLRWLKEKGVTAVVTGEAGVATLTRHGLEEYISDCVIVMDQRVDESVVTRRLRVMKYRGSIHGANEYPFLIDQNGLSVLPVTSVELDHAAVEERISTGIAGLDEMLGNKGYYRGSSILASGTAGTGKTSLAAHLVDAACRRGERCVFFAFEESRGQLTRNMRSIGIDLDQWVKKGLLHFHAARPTMYGLEMHLVRMHKIIEELKPSVVVVDPISSLTSGGLQRDVKGMLLRMIDYLKRSGVTAYFTALTSGTQFVESTELDVSSLVDTWLLVRDLESGGERNRLIYVLKSRGMSHSNQVREFLLTDQGVKLRDVYIGSGGVLAGSSRLNQENRERELERTLRQDLERKQLASQRRLRSLQNRMEVLALEIDAEKQEQDQLSTEEDLRHSRIREEREAMARSRYSRQAPAIQKGNGRGSRNE